MSTTLAATRPEVGRMVRTGRWRTNVLEMGEGPPVILVHGSGPGVSAYANWRLTMPVLASRFRVIAPDMFGFGFSEGPQGLVCSIGTWTDQLFDLMDALGLGQVVLVGNSFGGAVALAAAIARPERVRRLVLCGSVGVPFPITPGLDAVWGYEPTVENMKRLLDWFAFDNELITDELVELRYRASIEPGFQKSYAGLFPAPRQRWVDALASNEVAIAGLPHETLILHGREDRVVPISNSFRLLELIQRAQLHVFGRCGHWTQIERAAHFSGLIAEFLE
ncbi:alpha/beta fold hydrolase [Paraburkholderia sp. GAS32]|uniref:alpha/beta fold hydrolase n=1 Tax=Paraburkholderia sp. GAS32 TaxID=3035129 RepID=UPI003D23CA28